MARAIARPPGEVIAQAPTIPSSGSTGAHPWAWWGWALCTATAITLVRAPLLIVLLLAAVAVVVTARRSQAPWARSVSLYFGYALVIVAVRVVLQSLFGVARQGLVLFTLPQLRLPAWAAGITVGGPVTLPGVVAAVYEGIRLGGVIVCIGAANSLANPRRALKSVPAAFHELSVAVAISLSLAPQLVESLLRVRAARRLRGRRSRGLRATVRLLIPVLDDAIDRSLTMAAGMASRGYGRTGDRARVGAFTTVVLLLGVGAVTMAAFVFPSIPNGQTLGFALLAAGVAAVVVGLRSSGRRLQVTRHARQPWRLGDSLLLAQGLSSLVGVGVLQRYFTASMSASPDEWPSLHPLFLVLAGLTVAVPILATTTETVGEEGR